jgi:hypothetical protein
VHIESIGDSLMTTTMPRTLREPIIWLLLVAGMLSPLGVFPITRSCIPLASNLFCFAASCLVWMVIRLLRRRGILSSALWPENSPEIKRWKQVRTSLYLFSMIFFVVSLSLSRPWRPGQINWQGVFSAPGYMFLIWAGIVGNFIQAKLPGPQRRPNGLGEVVAPIRSDHWGMSSGISSGSSE